MVRHARGVRTEKDRPVRPGVPDGLHPVLRLQQTAGNRAVQRLMAERSVQRDDTTTEAAPTAGAKLGAKVKGKRPKPTNIPKDVADCKEAADYLNSGAYTGEAHPVFKPTAGKVKPKKQKDGTFKAEVTITWKLTSESTMELTDFRWPGMTKAEKAAVKKFKQRLKVHEIGHFDVQSAVIKAQAPSKIWATGETAEEAIANVQAEADRLIADMDATLAAKDDEYDTTITDHGRTQSAYGGEDVTLDCPAP